VSILKKWDILIIIGIICCGFGFVINLWYLTPKAQQLGLGLLSGNTLTNLIFYDLIKNPLFIGGFILIGYGVTKRRDTRFCPNCKGKLGKFPSDINACPYCGHILVLRKTAE
jgi:hypothetical protein